MRLPALIPHLFGTQSRSRHSNLEGRVLRLVATSKQSLHCQRKRRCWQCLRRALCSPLPTEVRTVRECQCRHPTEDTSALTTIDDRKDVRTISRSGKVSHLIHGGSARYPDLLTLWKYDEAEFAKLESVTVTLQDPLITELTCWQCPELRQPDLQFSRH